MNHPFLPHRWGDGNVDLADVSDEHPVKRRRCESVCDVSDRHYATVSLTWSVDVEKVTYSEVHDVVVDNPLLNHLYTIDNGPPSPVAHEDINQEDG